MTALSIGKIFHSRPILRRKISQPKIYKRVEIPVFENDKLYNKLYEMQNSLDYMATNYKLNFIISQGYHSTFVLCYDKNFNKNLDGNLCTVNESDEDYDVARKIYEIASTALRYNDESKAAAKK